MTDQRGDDELRQVRSATAWLILGLWAFAMASFAGTMVLGRASSLSSFAVAWLSIVTLSGLALSVALNRLASCLRRYRARTRWAGLGAAVVAMAALQALVDGLLRVLPGRVDGVAAGAGVEASGLLANGLVYLGLFGSYAAVLELIALTERFASRARRTAQDQTRAAEARELARESQLQVLRLQMNPHFLFNALNSISALVGAGRTQTADLMISRLSQFMRASLQSTEEAMTPLGDELSAITAYLDIESIRFADALDVEIDCPEALRAALVPNLILQPVMEAAVTYALAASNGLRRLRLEAAAGDGDLSIVVRDQGRADALSPPAPVELESVRRRLGVIYGGAARVEVSDPVAGFKVRLRLPLNPPMPAEPR